MGKILNFDNVYLEYPDDLEFEEEEEPINKEEYKQVVKGRKAFENKPLKDEKPLQK